MLRDLRLEDVQSVLTGDLSNRIAAEYPFYSLGAPGMPIAGPNFIKQAKWLSANNAEHFKLHLAMLYLKGLYSPADYYMPIDVGNTQESLLMIPGHLWGGDVSGPVVPGTRPVVMVIGKMPGPEDLQQKRNFSGSVGSLFREILVECGATADETSSWYVTSLVKWHYKNPRSTKLPDAWIKDCLPLLHQEFKLIRPDYVLCLGAESTKAVCGANNPLKSMNGRTLEITIPVHDSDETPEHHTMQVMAVMNPAAITHQPDLRSSIVAGISQFLQLVRGKDVTNRLDDIEIVTIDNKKELKQLVDTILKQSGLKKIGVDLEWDQRYPTEPDAYVRTVQISHKSRFGAVIKLRDTQGNPAFSPTIAAAVEELNRLLDRDDVQIGGAHFASDIPWLESLGVPILKRFKVPATVEELNNGNYAGGFDVAVAEHAHNETGQFALDDLAIFRCKAEPWDLKLQEWLHAYAAEKKIKVSQIPGFGACPDEILLPYAGYDVALTRELMDVEAGLLNSDRFGHSCWIPYHTSMLAYPAFVEMHMTGLPVDHSKIIALTACYQTVQEKQLLEFRSTINWPTFNPGSNPQCVEFLFGEQFNAKMDADGNWVRKRPEGAVSLGLTPIKSTTNQPWALLVSQGEASKHVPSTDKEVCGILASHHPLAGKLRDIRFIRHILQNVLKPPQLLESGELVYTGGIGYHICSDGRVRSRFSQLKETGRSGSAVPALQNWAKRREAAYKKIAGDQYIGPMRATFCGELDAAEPTVLMEADFQGAELLCEAVLSRDAQMIEHCIRGMLSEDHPDYYDIHSNVAVAAFRLSCAPTKEGLKNAGVQYLRVCAKNVIFGGLYGRSAEAIARQCQEEGNPEIQQSDAQIVMDAIFNMYAGVAALQDCLKARVESPGWIRTCFGRYRRFFEVEDAAALAAMQREALNFPAQSMVADALHLALYRLHTHKRKDELGYKIVLPVHDAVLLLVPARSVDTVRHEILPECMCERVSFKSCDLNGTPYMDSPDYRFGIDVDVHAHWGEALTVEDCVRLGLDKSYAHSA